MLWSPRVKTEKCDTRSHSQIIQEQSLKPPVSQKIRTSSKIRNYHKAKQRYGSVDKEFLYDENIRLKQKFHHIKQENIKLKTQVMSTRKELKSKHLNSGNIVMNLKQAVRSLKNQLEKREKQIEKMKAAVKIHQRDTDEKSLIEQNKKLKQILKKQKKQEYTKKEVFDLKIQNQDLKKKLEATNDKFRELGEHLQSVINTQNHTDIKTFINKLIQVTSPYYVDQEKWKKISLHQQSYKSSREKIQVSEPPQEQILNKTYTSQSSNLEQSKLSVNYDQGKFLNRQLAVKPNMILESFFRKLSAQAKQRGQSAEQFVNLLGKPFFEFPQIWHTLLQKDIKSTYNQVQAVFKILNIGGKITNRQILEQILKYSDDLISERSSDISSPKTVSNVSKTNLNIDFQELQSLQDTIDFFLILLRKNKVSKEAFIQQCQLSLSDQVSKSELNRIFLGENHRIEDGVQRNEIVSYFLSQTQIKQEIIQNMVRKIFFQFDEEGVEQEIRDAVIGGLDHVLENCKMSDRNKRGKLAWDQIERQLKSLEGMNREHLFLLKEIAYRQEENLFSISYEVYLENLKEYF